MKNKSNKNKVTVPKKSKILILITIFCLLLAYLLVVRPAINQNHFTSLGNNMQKLHAKMQAVAQNSETIKFTKKCDQQLSGDWPTGKYYCDSSITLEKTVSSIDETTDIQARFFPVIDQASFLKPTSKLITTPLASFGKEFIVSSSEKKYEVGSIRCTYLNKLSSKSSGYALDRYGDSIEANDGNLSLVLSCSGLADQNWYND